MMNGMSRSSLKEDKKQRQGSGRKRNIKGQSGKQEKRLGGREEETGGGTAEASRGGETTERGSGETDEGRGGTTETKRSGRRLPSGSGSTGGGRTGAEKKLVETDKSGNSRFSSVREGDEFDRPTPLDEKTTGPVSPQRDSGATPGAGRKGERVRNRVNRCR